MLPNLITQREIKIHDPKWYMKVILNYHLKYEVLEYIILKLSFFLKIINIQVLSLFDL